MRSDQYLIKNSIRVIFSLTKALELTGGNTEQINDLNMPLGEFLDLCIRYNIGFTKLEDN